MRTHTVHGHVILSRRLSRMRGSEIICAFMGLYSPNPFVIWRMDPQTGICEGGEYCPNLKVAAEAFETSDR